MIGKVPEVNFGGERLAASSASGEMMVLSIPGMWGGVFLMGVTKLEERKSCLFS